MKKCNFENWIDEYLFDRLDEAQKEAFEEHYFNCLPCFEKMEGRSEMLAVVRSKGSEIFPEQSAPAKTRLAWLEPVADFLSPRQWAVAAVSAVLITVLAIGIIPSLKKDAPQFFINDDLVRGSSIILISPVINNLSQIPSEYRWQSLGEDTEYKLFIYSQEDLLWSTTTKANFVVLPEEIKSQMKSGKKYSWQVKAFSPEGTLIAVSSRVQFNFDITK